MNLSIDKDKKKLYNKFIKLKNKEVLQMYFHERLRKARIKRNLTSKDMAKKLGVANSSYSQYETGKREPDVLKIKAISKILNVSADYLLFGQSSAAPPETYTADEQQHINKYRTLNDLGKNKADEYITDLSENPKYTTSENSAPPVFASDLIAADLVKEIKAAKSKTPIK